MAKREAKLQRQAVTVLGHRIPIAYKDLGEEKIAEYDNSPPSIWLNTNPKAVWNDSALLHETLHAILDLTGQNQGLTPTKEEGLVKALENGLANLVSFKEETFDY